MNCLELVTVYSKTDLTTLWNIVRERFPEQAVLFQTNTEGGSVLKIKRQYLSAFSMIFSMWMHQNFYRSELENIFLQYDLLTEEERECIFKIVIEKIKAERTEMAKLLQEKVLDILADGDYFNLEGFIIFGIQEYCEQLEYVVEDCFDAYFSEQDYLEFLDLLRYFIEIEEYRFGHLLVLAQQDGKYQYYDESMQNITRQCLSRFLSEFKDEYADPDDCLITILILLLPEKISLYGAENIANPKFLETLKNIFGNRFNIFEGREVFAKKKL